MKSPPWLKKYTIRLAKAFVTVYLLLVYSLPITFTLLDIATLLAGMFEYQSRIFAWISIQFSTGGTIPWRDVRIDYGVQGGWFWHGTCCCLPFSTKRRYSYLLVCSALTFVNLRLLSIYSLRYRDALYHLHLLRCLTRHLKVRPRQSNSFSHDLCSCQP